MFNWLLGLLCRHKSWHIPVLRYGPAPFKVCDRCGYWTERHKDKGLPYLTVD